ncbi:hypothetical protein MWN41_07855 [Ornithobacterium rhinotracheale]|uniref:hypothetical protein n=1 Tax=Ornithobacterium rhinotracheale TaxID=28251 RepID=UPI001FF4D0C8|nr:hypothetical protein [Ornithobacterium rhinotracheale]MCK0202927.1 hypothetical protein [Ornithobacterium rhinotracheale]
MKKLSRLSVFLLSIFLIIGCKSSDDDGLYITNSPTTLEINFFKNGKDFISPASNSIRKDVKGKIIPEKGNSFSFAQEKRINSGGADCLFPLYLNDIYKCTENDCKTRENKVEEVFRLIIQYKENEIFNKKLKLKYVRIGHPFESIETASFFDEKDKTWKPYKPEKTPLLDAQGHPTGYEFEVKL